jgi:hypothetical protein
VAVRGTTIQGTAAPPIVTTIRPATATTITAFVWLSVRVLLIVRVAASDCRERTPGVQCVVQRGG